MQDFQLNDNGICSTCNILSLEMEYVQCGICKLKFHAVCNSSTGDDKWATKSMIATFKASSTKRNFQFLCNYCLTSLENKLGDLDGQRIRKMEENMENINKELAEIKSALVAQKEEPVASNIKSQEVSEATSSSRNNMWFDTDRLATVKAKLPESVLVINKSSDAVLDKSNEKLVEDMVIQGHISSNKLPLWGHISIPIVF